MIDSIICPYISIYRGVMVATPVRPRRATGLDQTGRIFNLLI